MSEQEISQQIQAEIVRGCKELTKAGEKLVDHQFNEAIFKHRLCLNGEIGPWVPYDEVAYLGDYRAFHPHRMIKNLPQVFRIDEGNKSKDYVGGAY